MTFDPKFRNRVLDALEGAWDDLFSGDVDLEMHAVSELRSLCVELKNHAPDERGRALMDKAIECADRLARHPHIENRKPPQQLRLFD